VSVIDDHSDALTRRRATATRLVQLDEAAARIATAPPGYLLAHAGGDIARHVGLLSPLPAAGEVRVVATPGRAPGTWHLDVATRDRPGVLAAFTGVLAAQQIDVVQAVLATWDDGAALEAFVVRSAHAPDPHELQPALAASLRQPLGSDPVDDARLCFDDAASPLYTRCDVRAGDRPGLLHAIAVAIATAGADVHAARVTTVDQYAHDVFDLSDPAGRKLDVRLQQAIATHLRDGV
jgi:[protein-PII] uridylyltransferase